MYNSLQLLFTTFLLVLALYQIVVLFNKWYYPYFIEKINRRHTNDFDKKNFKENTLFFIGLCLATALFFLIPMPHSINITLIVLILSQFYIINRLSIEVKMLYSTKK